MGTSEGCAAGILYCVAIDMTGGKWCCGILGVSEGTEIGIRLISYGEVLFTTIGVAYRRKIGGDEVSDMVSSYGYFDVIDGGKIEGVVT